MNKKEFLEIVNNAIPESASMTEVEVSMFVPVDKDKLITYNYLYEAACAGDLGKGIIGFDDDLSPNGVLTFKIGIA